MTNEKTSLQRTAQRFETVGDELNRIYREIDVEEIKSLPAAEREAAFAEIRSAVLQSEALLNKIRKERLVPLGQLHEEEEMEERIFPDR